MIEGGRKLYMTRVCDEQKLIDIGMHQDPELSITLKSRPQISSRCGYETTRNFSASHAAAIAVSGSPFDPQKVQRERAHGNIALQAVISGRSGAFPRPRRFSQASKCYAIVSTRSGRHRLAALIGSRR